jgi:hypothetical protein
VTTQVLLRPRGGGPDSVPTQPRLSGSCGGGRGGRPGGSPRPVSPRPLRRLPHPRTPPPPRPRQRPPRPRQAPLPPRQPPPPPRQPPRAQRHHARRHRHRRPLHRPPRRQRARRRASGSPTTAGAPPSGHPRPPRTARRGRTAFRRPHCPADEAAAPCAPVRNGAGGHPAPGSAPRRADGRRDRLAATPTALSPVRSPGPPTAPFVVVAPPGRHHLPSGIAEHAI